MQIVAGSETGANTGTIFSQTCLPPRDANVTNQDAVFLTFTSNGGGQALSHGETSSFTIAPANNYAPASLASRSISSVAGGKNLGTGVFNHDGTFTFNPTGGAPETMTYTYAPGSPLGAMLVLTHANGWTSYVQWQFAGASTGSWYETDYDDLGNYISVESGTFALK